MAGSTGTAILRRSPRAEATEDAAEPALAHALLGDAMRRWLQAGPGAPRLSVEDLTDLNRWLCLTRLRASFGVFLCAAALRWIGSGDIAVVPLVGVCLMLALLSTVGLTTGAAARWPWGFFHLQTAIDLVGVTVGIWVVAGPLEALIFRFLFALVLVPVSLVSVTGGIVMAGLASAGHLALLGLQYGFVASTFTRVEALAYPSLFLLVVQQCFFYGSQLAAKNRTLASLAERLDEHRAHLLAQATMSDALLDVARSLSDTLDAPELLRRLNVTTHERLAADWCATCLVDPARRTFRLAASSTSDLEAVDLGRLELPLAGWTPAARLMAEPIVTLRGADAARLPGVFASRQRLDTVLLAGFHRDGALVGFIGVGFAALADGERPRVTEFLRGIAQHATIVLRNAHLLEEVRLAGDMKSEFVGAVSHELRSPLNVTLGYLEMLLEQAFGPITAEQRGTLGKVRQQQLVLLEMITALLDMNRLESGRLPTQRELVDVRALLDEVTQQLPDDWRRSGVALTIDVAANVPAIETDAGKVKTIVRNLLHNALKFTDRGWVSVVVDATPAGDLAIAVRDTGCGIPDDAREYIFDMFRQVPGSRGGGVGLGLHLVRRLVDHLGGRLVVESELGRGSCFTVLFPQDAIACEDAPSEPDPPARAVYAVAGGGRWQRPWLP
jgi:signal transduction histidine kinase